MCSAALFASHGGRRSASGGQVAPDFHELNNSAKMVSGQLNRLLIGRGGRVPIGLGGAGGRWTGAGATV